MSTHIYSSTLPSILTRWTTLTGRHFALWKLYLSLIKIAFVFDFRALWITAINLRHLWWLLFQVNPVSKVKKSTGFSTFWADQHFQANWKEKGSLLLKTVKQWNILITLVISWKVKHDHRSVQRFMADSEHTSLKTQQGRFMPLSQTHQNKRAAAKMT